MKKEGRNEETTEMFQKENFLIFRNMWLAN